MTCKSSCYGDENPSLIRKNTYNGLFLCFLFWCYGWWADFVPSEMWWLLGMGIAIVLAIISATSLYKYAPESPQPIITSLVLSVLYVIPLVHSLPSLVTLLTGAPYSMTSEFHKIRESGVNRNMCDNMIEGDAIARAVPDHLCISYSAYNILDDNVTIRLEGKMTFMGFHIQNAFLANDPDGMPLLSAWRM